MGKQLPASGYELCNRVVMELGNPLGSYFEKQHQVVLLAGPQIAPQPSAAIWAGCFIVGVPLRSTECDISNSASLGKELDEIHICMRGVMRRWGERESCADVHQPANLE